MTFTITAIATCAGGGHWTLTATVDGQSRTVEISRQDLETDLDVRTAAVMRLRSAILEAGATTLAQMRTAVLNKEFKI